MGDISFFPDAVTADLANEHASLGPLDSRAIMGDGTLVLVSHPRPLVNTYSGSLLLAFEEVYTMTGKLFH